MGCWWLLLFSGWPQPLQPSDVHSVSACVRGLCRKDPQSMRVAWDIVLTSTDISLGRPTQPGKGSQASWGHEKRWPRWQWKAKILYWEYGLVCGPVMIFLLHAWTSWSFPGSPRLELIFIFSACQMPAWDTAAACRAGELLVCYLHHPASICTPFRRTWLTLCSSARVRKLRAGRSEAWEFFSLGLTDPERIQQLSLPKKQPRRKAVRFHVGKVKHRLNISSSVMPWRVKLYNFPVM